MAMASLLAPGVSIPQPDSSWLSNLGGTLGDIGQNVRADRSFNAFADRIGGSAPAQPQQAGFLSRLTGGGQQAAAAPAAAPRRSLAIGDVDPSIKSGIVQTASSLGIDPVDLATAISYETGGTFDPTKGGPTTQWGRHRGLIQFGEPQAQKYGVNWDDPINSQLGADGAVAKYLKDTGVQPGMGLLDVYSAINAGGVGRYGASDANNGGAPGNVADKVNNQMGAHRQRALALLGADAAAAAAPNSSAGALNAMAAGAPGSNAAQVLRPFQPGEERPNPDGSYSTEISTTWQLPDGSWTNVPSLWMGPNGPKQFDPKDEDGILGAAQQFESQNGPTFQRYGSEQEAVQAAQQRSAAGGAGAGPARAPAAAPMQTAQQGGGNIIAQGVTPVARGTVDPSLIQYMLRDRNLRQTGLQLWAANVQGQKASEPWQFVNLPDGTLARANQQTGAVERLGNFAKPNDDATVVGDNLVRRSNGQVIYEGKPKDPASWNEFQKAKGDGFTGTYADWEKVKVPGTSVTVNSGETDKFYENLDKKNAETFSAMSDSGIQARSKLGQIDRLDSLLSGTPQGYEGAIKQWLGDIGVKTEGLDNLQATRAIIEKMVPEQRAPGSGTMSDGDIAMFRNSLPRVINQPGGNALIMQTLRGITDYQMKQGEIADQVADRTITPAEGRKRLRELPNPLSDYRESVKGFKTAPAANGSGVQRAVNPTTGEVLELRDGQWVKVK